MSHPSEYPEQLEDQSMGSQSNGLPAVAPVVPSTIEEPGIQSGASGGAPTPGSIVR